MRGAVSRLQLSLVVAVAVIVGSAVFAQQIMTGGRYGGYNRLPPRFATLDDFDGSWMYCRGYYRSVYREDGGSGWNTDYPAADNNFSVRLMELTRVHVPVDGTRQPHYVVVSLTAPT